MRYNKKICGGKRIESIDVCKAIGIILVVLGHTNNIPYNLYIAIFSFHMPFFFILSGYVYSREKNEAISFGKYAAKKFRQYMVPYFVFGFIDFAVDIVWRLTLSKQVVDWGYVLRSLRGILLCDLNLPRMCCPIWFLLCLFLSSLLFRQILKAKVKIRCVLMLVMVLLHFIWVTWLLPVFPGVFEFPDVLIAVFFMWVGYLFRRLTETGRVPLKGKMPATVSAVLSAACITVVLLTQNKANMRAEVYGNYAIFLVTSILISVSLICLSDNLSFLNNRFTRWLGKNTVYIVGLNYVCLDVSTEFYYLIPVVKHYSIHWTVSFLLTLAFCMACIPVCNLCKRWWLQRRGETR